MKIYLQDMVFYGYHGVHPEERTLGQRFIVNCIVETDPARDTLIRALDDTVDYTKVYETIRHIMEQKQFQLLENCVNVILDGVLGGFPGIMTATVRISKPSVPINGTLSAVEVEMSRTRSTPSPAQN